MMKGFKVEKAKQPSSSSSLVIELTHGNEQEPGHQQNSHAQKSSKMSFMCFDLQELSPVLQVRLFNFYILVDNVSGDFAIF